MNVFPITHRIDSAIRFFLYILIFWLPYSSAVIESCVATVSLLWLIKHGLVFIKDDSHRPFGHKLYQSFKSYSCPIHRPFLIFLIVCILSVLGGAFWDQSMRGFFSKILEWFALYLISFEVFREKKQIRTFFVILIFTSLVVVIDSFIQFYITGEDLFFGRTLVHGKRATAAFTTSNSLGGYLTLVVPLSAAISFIKFRNTWLRRLWPIIVIMMGWSLYLTYSQGAWLGVLSGLICLPLFYLRKRRLLFKFFLSGVLSCSAIFCYLNYRSHSLQDEYRPLRTESLDRSASWRWNLWVESLEMFYEKPLFGHGVNTYMMLLQQYRKGVEQRPNIPGKVWDATYAHNCYLQIAVETGILGLGAFLWIIGTLIKMMHQIAFDPKLKTQPPWQLVTMGLFAGIVAFLTQSFLDTNLFSLKLSGLFWVLVGIFSSLHSLLFRNENCDITKDINRQKILTEVL